MQDVHSRDKMASALPFLCPCSYITLYRDKDQNGLFESDANSYGHVEASFNNSREYRI